MYKKVCTTVGITFDIVPKARASLLAKPDLAVYLSKVVVQHQIDTHIFLCSCHEDILGRGSMVVAQLHGTNWRGSVLYPTVFQEPRFTLAYKISEDKKYCNHDSIVKTLYRAPREIRVVVPAELASSYEWPTVLKLGEDGEILGTVGQICML